ncbi:MAG: cytochrome c maturation protein CcmE [Terriglobia bacterium]
MTGQKSKFLIGSLVILGVLAWLGISGYQESKTYYVTISELQAQGQHAYQTRVRVAGTVFPGSIRRESDGLRFTLHQEDQRLEVVYVGTEPVPDTLVDDAQAIVTGTYSRENVFVAQKVQAKCASKYEALPPGVASDSADSGT